MSRPCLGELGIGAESASGLTRECECQSLGWRGCSFINHFLPLTAVPSRETGSLTDVSRSPVSDGNGGERGPVGKAAQGRADCLPASPHSLPLSPEPGLWCQGAHGAVQKGRPRTRLPVIQAGSSARPPAARRPRSLSAAGREITEHANQDLPVPFGPCVRVHFISVITSVASPLANAIPVLTVWSAITE